MYQVKPLKIQHEKNPQNKHNFHTTTNILINITKNGDKCYLYSLNISSKKLKLLFTFSNHQMKFFKKSYDNKYIYIHEKYSDISMLYSIPIKSDEKLHTHKLKDIPAKTLPLITKDNKIAYNFSGESMIKYSIETKKIIQIVGLSFSALQTFMTKNEETIVISSNNNEIHLYRKILTNLIKNLFNFFC